ncbi:MAG: tRNA lysidine(34) synthetase TilS, partial [Firmicutes bacterium]|nr:tRNA lysidine(34) synthetase TilS [Bacillota bacterium]
MFTDIAEQYDMLPAGSRVLVAVSGGADSVYLLHRLSEAAGYGAEPPSTPLWSLGVAHFNHRLRGAESARDAAFAENLAASLGLPFYLGAADVGACAQGRHMGLEAAARELRYAFLLKTAEENAYDRIATAHTADDNAETVLLNLIRGSGTKGLCGIPPVRGKIVRPILDVTEAEIRAWLDAREVAYVEDSSNNRDDFARNRLRHRVAPVLRELNPQYAAHILRAGALLRADAACLDGLAEAFLRENAEDAGRPEAGPYSASQMAKLPMPVAARVFRIAAGRTLGEKHIQAL